MSFQVGQKVVCEDASGSRFLTKGAVYTIKYEFTQKTCGQLVIISNVGFGLPFRADRFRPADEPA
jgi:hypothetical protein